MAYIDDNIVGEAISFYLMPLISVFHVSTDTYDQLAIGNVYSNKINYTIKCSFASKTGCSPSNFSTNLELGYTKSNGSSSFATQSGANGTFDISKVADGTKLRVSVSYFDKNLGGLLDSWHGPSFIVKKQ